LAFYNGFSTFIDGPEEWNFPGINEMLVKLIRIDWEMFRHDE